MDGQICRKIRIGIGHSYRGILRLMTANLKKENKKKARLQLHIVSRVARKPSSQVELYAAKVVYLFQ